MSPRVPPTSAEIRDNEGKESGGGGRGGGIVESDRDQRVGDKRDWE